MPWESQDRARSYVTVTRTKALAGGSDGAVTVELEVQVLEDRVREGHPERGDVSPVDDGAVLVVLESGLLDSYAAEDEVDPRPQLIDRNRPGGWARHDDRYGDNGRRNHDQGKEEA